MYEKLPHINDKPGVAASYFPTAMQTFIFRNWEMVSKERIAAILETNVDNVVRQAEKMGLSEQGNTDIWQQKGYITIIRSNWHVLPYDQLLSLLGWDEERLRYVLKEEDFLGIKLGRGAKPSCERVVYRELTEEEERQTERVRRSVMSAGCGAEKEPFDFKNDEPTFTPPYSVPVGTMLLSSEFGVKLECDSPEAEFAKEDFIERIKRKYGIDLTGNSKLITIAIKDGEEEEYHKLNITEDSVTVEAGSPVGIIRALYYLESMMEAESAPVLRLGSFERSARFGIRYIYPFSALYDGALDVDSRVWLPDYMLQKYAEVGVNGIWLQAILYRLVEFSYMPELSVGWQERLGNLKTLIQRAKKYGIKIYLYINEPRTMPNAIFEKYPDMKGAARDAYTCMCITSARGAAYLRDTMAALCRAVPDIGGFFTITMSENPTNCKSVDFDTPCERCASKAPWELAALANRLIYEGVSSVSKTIKVIAWDWAWSKARGFDEGDIDKCIDAIPSEVAIMTKRETEIPVARGDAKTVVHDYTISVDGIGELSRAIFRRAKKAGHQTAAKMQINNSWEISTVPYLPVYKKIESHIDSLADEGVDHLMLSWTVGGYPSPNIKLVSEAFFKEKGKEKPDYDNRLRSLYGDAAERVKKATDIFSDAFNEFPFDIGVLYLGPQNAGVSNPLYEKPTGYKSTMTCYAYDDITSWRSMYSEESFEKQFGLVADGFKKGLEYLNSTDGEIWDVSYVSYAIFASSYNQIRFIRLRDKADKTQEDIKAIKDIIANEREIAMVTLEIMRRRPDIGFEAANHYYYNRSMILEKIVNCDYLTEYYN